MTTDIRSRAVLWPKGQMYEDFVVGQTMEHHWGRTITESDTILFTTLTLSYNPLYFNREFAKAHGHRDIVVNPLYVFNTVFGLTVEDCSEGGGPFLGVGKLFYHERVYPGDTLTSSSVTAGKRLSDSNPRMGIVTWRTQGFNQNGALVIEYERSNLVRRRNPEHKEQA
jgi:itaconyl-CoA hydratase